MTIATINYIEIIQEYGKTKRRIANTQITVDEIVRMHLIGDSSIEWIAENFALTPSQIHAALSYYYDHQTEIDAAIQAENEEFEQQVATNSNKISQLRAQSKQ